LLESSFFIISRDGVKNGCVSDADGMGDNLASKTHLESSMLFFEDENHLTSFVRHLKRLKR
jgi:hypothetical protein